MARKVWLTQLTHFGSYDLTVITDTEHEGIEALREEFNKANKERGDYASSYTYDELLNGGDVRSWEMVTGKVEWN